jgi:hypothetical protein
MVGQLMILIETIVIRESKGKILIMNPDMKHSNRRQFTIDSLINSFLGYTKLGDLRREGSTT